MILINGTDKQAIACVFVTESYIGFLEHWHPHRPGRPKRPKRPRLNERLRTASAERKRAGSWVN